MQALEADHILIPLLDRDYMLAQIARLDGFLAMLYVTFRHMTLAPEVYAFGPKDVQAAVFTDLEPVQTPETIEAPANALHGLYPWDGVPQADFLPKC